MRRYLLAYDVADPERLRRVYQVARAHGQRVQDSLYEVLLTPRERVLLEGQLGRLINHEEDQVLLIELGPADQPPRLEIKALGQSYRPQRRENLIL